MVLHQILVLSVTLVSFVQSARILAIMPTPSYSHQIVFNPLWQQLSSRGHHVTLFTTDPIKLPPNVTNFRQIDWSFSYTLWHEKHKASQIIANFNTDLLKCLNLYMKMMKDIFVQELEQPEVMQILTDPNEHFDLVVAEILNPLMAAFSVRFNCPLIGVSPMDVTNFVHESWGNPISPALFPDFVSKFDNQMMFWERVVNMFYYLGSKLYFRYYFYPEMDKIVQQYFGVDTPKLEEIQKNVSLVFLNVNPLLHNVRPLVKKVIAIGGGTHFEAPTELPQDIKRFLDEASEGVIFFSLGSNFKSKELSRETKLVLLETFSELPFKVLWKFEDTGLITNSNVMIRKWLPQQQILRHKNTKLFITQGGLQSLEEAINYEVPVLCFPVYIDQFSNVKKIVQHGMGLSLDLSNLQKEELKKAITKIVGNSDFKKSSKKLSKIMKDSPVSGVTKAIWWSEYVIKYKGTKFLHHPEVPSYQYFLMDVLLFLLLLIFNVILLLYVCFKCCIKKGGM